MIEDGIPYNVNTAGICEGKTVSRNQYRLYSKDKTNSG